MTRTHRIAHPVTDIKDYIKQPFMLDPASDIILEGDTKIADMSLSRVPGDEELYIGGSVPFSNSFVVS